jgi:hypothetical protein
MGKISRIEDAARFVAAMRGRLKTRKACRDMIFAEKYIRRKRQILHRTVIHAREILDGKAN